MKVRSLRPGDWVATSWPDKANFRAKFSGLLISVVRQPGNNEGPVAYVLSSLSGLHKIKASHIIERRPIDNSETSP